MIQIYTGLPGAGKTTYMAHVLRKLLHRNKKWFLKTGEKRYIYSNMVVSEIVHKEFPDFVKQWVDPAQLVSLKNVDVLWDEVATHLDSTQWADMSLELKRWLQQHRKRGIEIYGTTQDFSMIDISMRRLVSDLFWISNIFANRSPSPTMPPVKHIFGLSVRRRLDPQGYDENIKTSKNIFDISFLWIDKTLVSLFDTLQEIEVGEYPPLRRIQRHWINPKTEQIEYTRTKYV